MAADGLTPKQRAFVDEYLVDLNATQAAIRAGYSEKTAHSQGPRLLENVGVAEAIQAALDERAQRTQVSADRVVAELAAVAFADLRDVATWDEDALRLVASDDLSDDAARALREVTARVEEFDGEQGSRTTRHMQVRQHDKLRALELLGKHLGMFKRDAVVDVRVGITLDRLHELAAAEAEAEEEEA